MDHRRSMAGTSGQTYEEPLLAGWAARGWGMGGGTWAMKACLPAMVLLRAVEGGERRAWRVVVEVAVGNALPASSGRVALSTLRDGPPAGRSGRRRPWAGQQPVQSAAGCFVWMVLLVVGFLSERDERPSVPVPVPVSASVWVLWVPSLTCCSCAPSLALASSCPFPTARLPLAGPGPCSVAPLPTSFTTHTIS
jgi:hypothetical protein